jgi:hypothetical protein
VSQSPSQTPELALFDLVITEFDARTEAPVSRIVRVFGVDEPAAQALVAALPAMVCQRVNQVRATHFARALLSIGARIEVRDQTGALVELGEWLDAACSAEEVQAETAPANDNDHDVTAPPSSVTVFRGTDALAATLGATQTPAPQAPRMSHAEREALQHEPTEPRIATPQPISAAAAAPGWGELQREPMRARAASRPSTAIAQQPPSELIAPATGGVTGPREFAAEDLPGDRLSLEPPSHAAARAGSQPLMAAGQHPAMRGASRPLSGQLSQPLTAAAFVGARPGARAPKGKLSKGGEQVAFTGAEQPNDWSDLELPASEANTVDEASASGPSLGPPTTGQGPRLHTLDLSGPALSLDPSALRAVATSGGVAYEAGPGRARKAGAGDPELARGITARAREDSAALPRGAGRGAHSANARGSKEAAPVRGGAGRGVEGASARGSKEAAPVRGGAGRGVEGASARGSKEAAPVRGGAGRGVEGASVRGSKEIAPVRGGAGRGVEAASVRGADDAAAPREGAVRRGVGPRAREDSPAVRGGAAGREEAARARGVRGAEAARRAANDDVAAMFDEDAAIGGETSPAHPAGARGRDAADDSKALRRGAAATRDTNDNQREHGPSEHVDTANDEGEFWESFADTLAFPFRGSGVAWLVSIGIWAIGASVLSVLAWVAPIAGWTVMLFANSSVLAICADYHRRCMWAVADHDGMLVQGPEFDPTHIMREYVRAGANVAAFAALSQLPLALWLAIMIGQDGQRLLDLTFSAHFWLLAALPSLYWPAALASASLYNRGAGVWFLPVGIRAIVRAPLMYFAIFGAGALTFLVPWFVFAAVAREAGIPGSLMLAIAGFPMAASHGVMGALTGLLMRSKSDLFA